MGRPYEGVERIFREIKMDRFYQKKLKVLVGVGRDGVWFYKHTILWSSILKVNPLWWQIV